MDKPSLYLFFTVTATFRQSVIHIIAGFIVLHIMPGAGYGFRHRIGRRFLRAMTEMQLPALPVLSSGNAFRRRAKQKIPPAPYI
jgi:hypothetical protein